MATSTASQEKSKDHVSVTRGLENAAEYFKSQIITTFYKKQDYIRI